MLKVEVNAKSGPKAGMWELSGTPFSPWGKSAAYVKAFVLAVLLQGLYDVRITENGKIIWENGFWYA